MKDLIRYKLDAVALGVLCFVIYIYLMQFLGFDLSKIFGDLGDARLNNYFLEHGYQYFLGNHPFFWSAPFYYPAENVMTYSDNHLGTLPFYSLFRLIGCDTETSYQLWMILIFLLNGISAYIVLRLFKFNILGSFAGALLFSIAAPVMIKTGHFQLMPRFMIPILFYSAVKYVESLNIEYFYIFCFAFVYQFYIGIYIGFFAIVGLIVLLPFIVMYIRRKHNLKTILNTKYVTHLALATTLSITLLFLLFEPYLSFKEVTGGRSWNEISSMLPRLKSWFYTTGSFVDFFNQVGRKLPMQHEHVMFLGIVPYFVFFIVLFFYTKKSENLLIKEYKNLIFSAIIIIVLTFVFTLYINGFSLYKYIFYKIPGFDAIRAVTRIILFLAFPFAILLAFLITMISKSSFKIKTKVMIIFIILAGGVIEQYRANLAVYDKKEAQNRYFSLYDKIKDTESYDIFYLNCIKPSPSFFIDELDAMFLSLVVNKPTINGYSGNIPQNYNLWNTNDNSLWLLNNEEYFLNKKLLILKKDKNEIINLRLKDEN